MPGIGLIIKAVARVGGRVLGRVAGPLGAAVTIGELGYLGLKYSGTLENLKKLYCDRCRAEIPLKHIGRIASAHEVGSVFEVPCPKCGMVHAVSNLPLTCPACQKIGRSEPEGTETAVPTKAKFLLLTCRHCHEPLKIAKNKYHAA